MTDSRMESLVVEKSLPDGNCVFNAWVLGWCRPDILNQVDRLKPPQQYPSHIISDFIKQSAIALGVGLSFLSIKNRLLYFRVTDKIHLQRQMAPVFRRLAINLARHNPTFRARTEMHLKTAFRDYVMPIKKSVDDDNFSRHKFIREKFAELNPLPKKSWLSSWSEPLPQLSEQTFTESCKKLMDWWFGSANSGYESYLNAMEKQGEWGGDTEIDLFGDFFDVDVLVKRKNFLYHIHVDHGAIEEKLFKEYEVIELRNRGIVYNAEHKDGLLRFMPLTEAKLIERLNAVPDCDQIREFVLEAGMMLREKPVPDTWQSSIPQLIQRNIIRSDNNQFVFNCDGNTAANLLEEFPEKEKMLTLWRLKYKNKHAIILNNEDAHWDNLLSVSDLAHRGLSDGTYNSLKIQLATLLAANALYLALLKKLKIQRFSFFANPIPLLQENEESAIMARSRTPEM